MTRWQVEDPALQRTGTDDLPLFQPQVRTLARRSDPDTSRDAALQIAEHLTELQARVLQAYRTYGAMSAKVLEQLPEFADLGFSTARKRCSEGVRDGWLRDTGRKEDGSAVLEANQASTRGME